MRRLKIPVLAVLFITSVAGISTAQDTGVTDKADKFFSEDLDDAITQDEEGLLTLRFFNAVTGDPITAGKVTVSSIGEFETDARGLIRFKMPKDGDYDVEFAKQKFITSSFKVKIQEQAMFQNNRFSVSPGMRITDFRIVLDWAERPRDLDAHFLKRGDYHISYRNMRSLSGDRGRLDRDDRDGLGPETITVDEVSSRHRYEYYVHDYSHRRDPLSRDLSKSLASVKIYGRGQLLKVIEVPPGNRGTRWNVFNIVDGDIEIVNTFE